MLPDLTNRRAMLMLCAAAITAALVLGTEARTGPRPAIDSGMPHSPARDSRGGWIEYWTIQRHFAGSVAATLPGRPARLDHHDRSIPGIPAVVTCVEVFEFTASLDPGIPMRQQLLDAVEANLGQAEMNCSDLVERNGK